VITKVIVRAEVEDVERWKSGFVTHSDLFLSQAITIAYWGTGDDKKVAACFETTDLASFMAVMESPDTAAAMSEDGIVEGSVEIFVLDALLDLSS
jgi:hypothetical protein